MKIIARHLVPGFISHIIASTTPAIPAMIIAQTSLSFLGIGLRPRVVSWGVLLQEAQNIRSLAEAPWLLAPGFSRLYRAPSAVGERRPELPPSLGVKWQAADHICSKNVAMQYAAGLFLCSRLVLYCARANRSLLQPAGRDNPPSVRPERGSEYG
ncbi:hypothetical protein ACVINI_007479 [Rhizobium beringeri]